MGLRTREKGTVRRIFLREVERRLPDALNALQQLQSNAPGAHGELYRFAHTLKGSGAMAGLPEIAEPAAEITVALRLSGDYGVPLTPGMMDFLRTKMEEIIQEVGENLERGQLMPLSQPSFQNRGKRVLVVDDDPTISWLVKERLERDGLAVMVCGDVTSAERAIVAQLPDLIVLDILLPGESGIDLCRRLRADSETQSIPIIFLTVKGRLQDKIDGFTSGADDYLAKPFEVEELAVRIQAMLHRMGTIQDWALRDELTGVHNRRYLLRGLREAISRAERSGESFSLAILDTDLFKNVNDQFGHQVGDEVLHQVAQRIATAVRAEDIVCRYGGEEFIIVFPDTAKERASLVLERLREAFSSHPLMIDQQQVVLPITISAGVASFPQDGVDTATLLTAADAAMYRAKREGRNRVVVADEGQACI